MIAIDKDSGNTAWRAVTDYAAMSSPIVVSAADTRQLIVWSQQAVTSLDAASIEMLHEEGLDNVFARHDRLAEATRRAIKAWGLDIICRDPKYYSPTITAVLLPEGHDADAFRALALEQFNISYGASFGRFAGKMFRIGHLGDINDAMLLGGLAATEMALALSNIPHKKGGVQAAMDYLVSAHGSATKQAAE